MALLAFPEIAKYADDQSKVTDPTIAELLKDPVFQPIIGLMKRNQRVKVARELNVAILESQGLGGESRVKGLIRLMCFSEDRLEILGIGMGSNTGAGARGRGWIDTILGEIGG